ncbi:MAG: ABC transporter ATP-binding protein [Prevotella sp.]|nr:ABC transporter ATP-binding protein [Prevotella sp.]
MNDETIRLTDVSIGYKTRQGLKTVATGITASIFSGELTCLLGRNGVGKSTLLRTLAGFQPKLGGSIVIDGRQQEDYTARELAQRLGVVLTERPDVQQMTVWELVAMGRSPYTGFWGRLDHDDELMVKQAISQVGIDELAQRQVTTLSDGERQKVMIAKALAQQTSIIFLDEPTAFLDYPSKVETLLLLRRIGREARKTIFLSTHDLELALQVADRLWLMDDTTGLSIGTPAELAQKGVLAAFVERASGVSFDAATLSIHIQHEAAEKS